MPIFIDTEGHNSLGIGICDRCSRKMPLDQLHRDPNSQGLRVCRADLDQYDPWRLPAPAAERINLPFVRPDRPLGVNADYTVDAVGDLQPNTGFTPGV